MEVLGGDMSLGSDTELKFEIKVDQSQFPFPVPNKQSEGLNNCRPKSISNSCIKYISQKNEE